MELIAEHRQKLKGVEENLIYDLFFESCYDFKIKKFDHRWIGAYETAQTYLIEKGIITQEDCHLLA